MKTNSLFQISLPEEWEDVTVYTFKGPFDSGVQHNIVLVIDDKIDPDIKLESYVRQQMSLSKQALPGLELIKRGESMLLSGIPIYEVVYKYMPSDKQPIYQKQQYIIHKGKAYTFTSTFSKKTLKTIARTVEKIIGSFRPLTVQE